MTEHHSAMRWAAVSFTLTDNLMKVLREKGLLTQSDREKILERTLLALRNSSNVEIQGAEFLFHELCGGPQPPPR